MARTINEFKTMLSGGGARANQFEVRLSFPDSAGAVDPTGFSSRFMVKSAALPGQAIDEIAVEYRGRTLYVAGDRTFETWTTTIINDEDFSVRTDIERWMNSINGMRDNIGALGPVGYMKDLGVIQYSKNGAPIKAYELINCWPISIGQIDLSWDTRSEIETFDVTWRYTDFKGGGENSQPLSAVVAQLEDITQLVRDAS
tara:strand:- start:358 stop:957 length:600 start_codon:yes stop_codon:yes gene_type:complete